MSLPYFYVELRLDLDILYDSLNDYFLLVFYQDRKMKMKMKIPEIDVYF